MMLKTKMKITGIVSIMISLLAVSAAPVFAVEQGNQRVPRDSYIDCEASMRPVLDQELKSFMIFLDSTFRNKSSNSSLLNIAAGRYREYTNAVDAKFNTLEPEMYKTSIFDGEAEQVRTQYNEQIQNYIDCSALVSNEKVAAKEMMIKKIRTSNYQKKTIIMVEKYQAINAKMRELYFSTTRMYSLFLTFKNKLPFFVRICQ